MAYSIKGTLTRGAILALVASPLLAPFAVVLIMPVVWAVVYFVLFIVSIGHDATNTVPWVITDPDRSLLIYAVLLGFLGWIFLRGLGAITLIVAWLPFGALYGYMVLIGLGAYNDRGWTGYLMDNYQDNDCRMAGPNPSNMCMNVPKGGLKLPIFYTDMNDNVVKTIPYKQ
jgi:hypothetical protein